MGLVFADGVDAEDVVEQCIHPRAPHGGAQHLRIAVAQDPRGDPP
jgi:hypothetical protein